MEDTNKNITEFGKGLNQDLSPQIQPKGTYRFALNMINESENGDENFRSNENSNIECAQLKTGFIPIDKCYIGDGETAIFSVNPITKVSEIGILDNDCNYYEHVNDSTSSEKDKLNFSVSHQINSTYRLRRGCEKTVYFTDDLNRPRYYNFNKPENFKNADNTWSASKFNLQRTYDKFPLFQKIEVVDSGGNVEPGSYNIAIQLIDESFNTTEFITVSNIIKIYNDLSNLSYREINGSINSDVDFLNFPKTGKAIKVTFDPSSLDKNFLYYRLAIVESNSGTGIINKVVITENIPTTKNSFIYTGNNVVSEATEAEISQIANIIERAGSIEQIENRLLLANTKGSQVDFCKLQRYASKIKTDCITKTVILNSVSDNSNPKNPIQNINGQGYMPGEIYSFAVCYLFEDYTVSPGYHIPGRNPNVDPKTIYSEIQYSTGPNGEKIQKTFPMAYDNVSESTVYTAGQSCDSGDYWGLDCEGETLTGKNVRHHRFPLRSEINKPLIKDSLNTEQTQTLYQLKLNISGTLKVPKPCPEDNPTCGTDKFNSFDIRVSYKVDNQDFFFVQTINPSLFANGVDITYTLNINQLSQFHSSNNITDIVIEETDINGIYYPQYSKWNEYFTAQPVYTTTTASVDSKTQGRMFTTEILGVHFSGIEVPPPEVTGGKKVIGYFILRNERTEFDKTIIDSGVLVPSMSNSKYISHGLLNPDSTNLSDKVYGIIHPEHKFNDKEYVVYDKLIQQGVFNVIDKKYGKVNYDDVYDGSSFNKDKQKEGNDDGGSVDGSATSRGYDGWSLNIINRDSILSFESKNEFEINSTNIKDRFYLDALGNKSINDNANDVYNIAADNKIGMIVLDNNTTIPSTSRKLPYVVMYKKNLDPYSNFRILPYYKENINPIIFNNGEDSSVSIFNGDSYVSSVRYVNTIFWDNRVAKRAGKTNAFKKIIGAFLVVLGALLAPITGGSSTLIIGAGIALIGAGALFISSGIKQDNFNRAYNEEYDKGLRQTVLDKWVETFYNYTSSVSNYFPVPWGGQTQHSSNHAKSGPSDDTIQWIGDCLTDLWFESSINTNLRYHFYKDVSPTFLDSPGRLEDGNNTPIELWEFFGLHYAYSNQQRYPISSLERHLVRKLLTFDQTRDDNKYYIGAPLGEYYKVNPDYLRYNKQKIFYHLPLEYDCCSDCKELFPHRIHYSEQSYQEELTDNYRTFLPNNYRDIEGETGEIVNVFRLYNNLYIHTKEALWLLPRNYQERITDQVVSYIGTGSYFEVPPQKILDDDTGASAGTQHKWGMIKTPAGVFFPSENQKKIYQFDGKQLKPISNLGLDKWFKNNLPIVNDILYYREKKKLYPNRDNPSNPLGTGFISTYDSRNERIIFTKKDFAYSDSLINTPDSLLCSASGTAIMFYNLSTIIQQQLDLGWNFEKVENCKLKFFKDVIKTRKETRYVESNTFKNVDYLVFRYNFNIENGKDLDTRTELISPVARGPVGFGRVINYDSQYLRWGGDNTNYGVECILIDLKKIKEDFPSATEVVFKCGAWWYSQRTDGNMNMNAEGYKGGVMTLDGPNYNFINQGGVLQGTYSFQTVNIQIPPLGSAGTNDANFQPYNNIGLFTYNIERGELSWNGVSGGEIPNEVGYIEVEVDVEYVEREYKYIEGTPVVGSPIKYNNSWTLSYSLKDEAWTSWHSYLPNFYINTPDKFYSWINGSSYFWKHNQIGSYQKFYNVIKPFIIEFVSTSNLVTKTWDSISTILDTKKYDSENQDFYDVKEFFNKVVFYNSRQSSGELNIKIKNDNITSYLNNQVNNSVLNDIIATKKESIWHINNLRDFRIDYNTSIWNKDILDLQSNYFIDKIVNLNSISYNKPWYQLESFRDKFLVVRYLFDKFADTKMIINLSIEDEKQSFR